MDKNNEKGAIVVEATISFTSFMFAIVIILSIVNICQAQAKIGTVLNGAAKDFSQYSYLYGMTKLNEKQAKLHGKAGNAKVTIDETIANTKKVINGSGTLTTTINPDPTDTDLLESAFSMVVDSLAETAKSAATAKVAELIVKGRLTTDEYTADEYLKHVGVVGGMKGIDFSDSVFCVGGTGKIILVADYKVHVLKLLNHNIEFRFKQAAVTEAWLGK